MVWQPGKSANPGGKPRAIAGASARLSRAIDELTDGGRVLYEALFEIAFGVVDPKTKTITPTGHTVGPDSAITFKRMRLEAIHALIDRWAGKPQATVEVIKVDETAIELDQKLENLNPDQLRALAALLSEDDADAAGGAPVQ